MIRIFIVDDHPVTITGLHTYFRPSRDEISVTGSASTIEEVLSKPDPGTFDVIFMDLWLNGGNPVDNFQRLVKKFPDKPILIYTGENSIHWQRTMFKAGAKAYISKQASKSEISQILERVMNGETVYTPNLNAALLKRKIYSYNDPKYGLSEDQKEILKYFMEGNTSRTIAGKMSKNITTIDRSIRDIMGKFGVTNKLELMKAILSLDDESLFGKK
jgi:DNA-binding NarL/FixJ family response regulator